MGKKVKYLVLDSETATLPFANDLANNDPDVKKKIAIARPLIYDIAWVICDRFGNVETEKNYLVNEIFFDRQIFETAYYKEKRPQYMEALREGTVKSANWDEIMIELINDMNGVTAVGAFNSMFDFKKAIPFTELYIRKYYDGNFDEFMRTQRRICKYIISNPQPKEKSDMDKENFNFRNENYPLFDIWGMACEYLLNTRKYKELCLSLNMITASGVYFKSSAESSYRYLCNKYDFIESHTALDDAKIEAFILGKMTAYRSIDLGVAIFPFRNLGYTYDFVKNEKKNPDNIYRVIEAMENYVGRYDVIEELNNYKRGVVKHIEELTQVYNDLNAALALALK